MLTIIKNTNHKIKHTKKSGMTKLRNIGYLRFGSKILQGFARFFTSLTPPLSLPLFGCRGKQMRGRGERSLYTVWGSLPPPTGLQAPYRPVEWRRGACRPAGGRQAPAKGLRANKFFLFTYKSLPPSCWVAGPACPLPGGRGIKL